MALNARALELMRAGMSPMAAIRQATQEYGGGRPPATPDYNQRDLSGAPEPQRAPTPTPRPPGTGGGIMPGPLGTTGTQPGGRSRGGRTGGTGAGGNRQPNDPRGQGSPMDRMAGDTGGPSANTWLFGAGGNPLARLLTQNPFSLLPGMGESFDAPPAAPPGSWTGTPGPRPSPNHVWDNETNSWILPQRDVESGPAANIQDVLHNQMLRGEITPEAYVRAISGGGMPPGLPGAGGGIMPGPLGATGDGTPDYTAPALQGLGPDSELTPLSHEDWLKSLAPDEYWRWASGEGAGTRFRDIFQPALEAAPNYYLSNPQYQRFLEQRFAPLNAQYLLSGLMNPTMEAMPTQGDEEVLGLGGPHFQEYLMGNPAVEGQDFWSKYMPQLYGDFGGEAPTDPAARMRYDVGQEELNQPGAALGLLTAASRAGLNPVFGRSVANVMQRRERAARATQPNQGGFDWFRSMRPAMSGIFSGV